MDMILSLFFSVRHYNILNPYGKCIIKAFIWRRRQRSSNNQRI